MTQHRTFFHRRTAIEAKRGKRTWKRQLGEGKDWI
jgi:hypothetical protein